MTYACAKFCKNSREPHSIAWPFAATRARISAAAAAHEPVMNLY